MNNLSFGGWDPIRRRAFAYYETIAGGTGAHARADGMSARHSHMTNSLNTPVEAFEHQYPLRVLGYSIRDGSGGVGLRRGGDGIRKQIEFLTGTEVTILSDRRLRGPYGLQGGQPGRPGRNTLRSGPVRRTLPGKVRFTASAGDALTIESPGGGGWGRSRKRSRAGEGGLT